MTNKIILTEDQQTIYDSLWKFLNEDNNHLALLNGNAGVGKSFLVIEFIKRVLADAMFNNIAICATTNKAVKVIRNMLPKELRNKITFSTAHSLLGLKHSISNNGKEVFKRDKNSPSKFGLYDLVIIDESSMLSDELFAEIEKQNYRNVKVLFVGDENQINPVNHEHSIPMLPHKREEFNIAKHSLTKIVRQAAGNPIIQASQKILKDEFKFLIGEKQIVEGTGYAMLNKHQPEVINNLLQHYFCSEEFDKDANHCKLIAWRNVTVDNFNKLIRGMKYGMNAPRIVKGEKLIVDKPIKGVVPDEILFNTNDELNVLELQITTKVVDEVEFTCYDTLVESDQVKDRICILHESSMPMYNRILARLADDAKKEKDAFKRGQKWIKFFDFQNSFAAVNFNYSITCHCSQGSTYKNTFVVYTDIQVNTNKEERKRILYTAVTRPKDMLYLM